MLVYRYLGNESTFSKRSIGDIEFNLTDLIINKAVRVQTQLVTRCQVIAPTDEGHGEKSVKKISAAE